MNVRMNKGDIFLLLVFICYIFSIFSKQSDCIFSLKKQECVRFSQFVQNFSKRQILWSLCSVDFHTFTLQLPIQTPHSVAPKFQVFVSSLQNCQNFGKTSTPGDPRDIIHSSSNISHCDHN